MNGADPRKWSPAVRAAIQPMRGPWTELRVLLPTRRLMALAWLAEQLEYGAEHHPDMGRLSRDEARHVAALFRQAVDQVIETHGPGVLAEPPL